jgi:choline dehydrogenase-like flavoprotein
MVGGGTVHYTGVQPRHYEVDFVERSRWGPISGTGFADWPITYAELEPYYTRAEWELGVSGLGGVSPVESQRSRAYPLPPVPVKSSGVLAERGAEKLGWHATPTPLAITTRPYRGREACVYCGFCQGFACENDSKSSTLATVIPVAEATGRCEIRPNSYVREIATDRNGLVTGAVYFDAQKREVFQRARAVVLCANGAETPRLLLLSTSNLFPNGLANSNGMVGKYLNFGAGATARGVFEHPLNDYKGVQSSRMIEDFYEADPARGFYGGGRMFARFGFDGPIAFALGGLPPDVPRWGSGYKEWVRENFTRIMTVNAFCTSIPLETNTITLDPNVNDAWGLPAMRVTYAEHPDTIRTREFFRDRCLELLDAAGAVQTWAGGIGQSSGGSHLMGSCRMGNDPQSSVVDRFHRAHDVPNLFIVDGSSFVTIARNHPTLTIEALAYRAGEYIAESARSGGVPAPA